MPWCIFDPLNGTSGEGDRFNIERWIHDIVVSGFFAYRILQCCLIHLQSTSGEKAWFIVVVFNELEMWI